MIRTIDLSGVNLLKRTFIMDRTCGDKPSGLSTPDFSEFSESIQSADSINAYCDF